MSNALASIKPGRRKLVTLTMRSTDAPLGTQITNLWNSFRKLRQRRLWKQSTSGAIAVLEITYNNARKQWHPHLHIAADAGFIHQKELSNEWLKCTLTSKIVDIRAVRSLDAPAKYLTAYLTKPPAFPPECRSECMKEYYAALDSHHTFRTYGTLRPSCVETGEEPDDYADDWVKVGSVCDLILKAVEGDQAAIAVLEAYHQQRHPLAIDSPFRATG